MKTDNKTTDFAQLSTKELFFALAWLLGIATVTYLERTITISEKLVTGLVALCSIALASKSFKGLEYAIKSWKNEEPQSWNKRLGTFGNAIIALFFIAAIFLMLSGGFLGMKE